MSNPNFAEKPDKQKNALDGTVFSIRLELKGGWRIALGDPRSQWDVGNAGNGIKISTNVNDSDRGSSIRIEEANVEIKTNEIKVSSGRVLSAVRRRPAWAGVEVELGIRTTTGIAHILFISNSDENIEVGSYAAVCYPKLDDPIAFDEKRTEGYSEHLHGPFNMGSVYEIKIKLTQECAVPTQPIQPLQIPN